VSLHRADAQIELCGDLAIRLPRDEGCEDVPLPGSQIPGVLAHGCPFSGVLRALGVQAVDQDTSDPRSHSSVDRSRVASSSARRDRIETGSSRRRASNKRHRSCKQTARSCISDTDIDGRYWSNQRCPSPHHRVDELVGTGACRPFRVIRGRRFPRSKAGPWLAVAGYSRVLERIGRSFRGAGLRLDHAFPR
jgi:hypothetical protein